MTAKFFAILTNQGAALLANATALGTKLDITQMAVGDGNGTLPVPDAAQTKLVNQKRIAPLNMLSVDANNASQIIAEQVIPENEGGFWIREIGLYDSNGILIAVANCPETYKPQLQEGSGRTQTIRMILIVSSTSAITLKIDPSVVLATRQYVDNKVIEVKAWADDLMRQHVAATNPHKQYAPLDSPALTGKPTAPTAAQTVNSAQIATTAFVKAVIAGLVNSSPAALDTLNELAAALGNDPNFATTVTNALAGKQPLDSTLNALSGKDVSGIFQYLGLGEAAKREVGTGANQIPDMSSFNSVLGSQGYCDLPNGWIIQSGGGTYKDAQKVSLPKAFPNAFVSITNGSAPNWSGNAEIVQVHPDGLSSFLVGAAYAPTSGSGALPITSGIPITWIAIGY